jgi:hypothetical protein
VTYLFKARTVEPEKQPLLANSSETTFLGNGHKTNSGTMSVARQQILNKQEYTAAARERLSKHVLAAMDMLVAAERCFLHGPCRDVISKDQG